MTLAAQFITQNPFGIATFRASPRLPKGPARMHPAKNWGGHVTKGDDMNYRRHTLLAGIAALALVTGTGFASAQQQPDHKGGASAKEPHAATQPMNKAPAAGKMSQGANQGAQEPNHGANTIGQKAQEEHPGAMTKPNQRAETDRTKTEKPKGAENRAEQKGRENRAEQKGGENRAEQKGRENRAEQMERQKKGETAQHNEAQPNGPKTGKNERNGLQGLQGNAAGVQLNDQQRTQIRNTVINAAGAPRVSSVNFDVTVGTVIPRGQIEIVPVPETLVQIEPTWRGFLYFVYEDEVVIVNPRDMRIVAVVYA
jgi:hypothetical protein